MNSKITGHSRQEPQKFKMVPEMWLVIQIRIKEKRWKTERKRYCVLYLV